MNFQVGDTVNVNPDHCYISYSQFIKWHWKYMLRWSYKNFPEANKPHTIIGIHRHVRKSKSAYDTDQWVLVVRDRAKRIFLMGESGIIRL